MKRWIGLMAAVGMTAQVVLAQNPSPSEEDQAAELAKQLQNPVASLISVPFQNNFDWGWGPDDDGFRYTLNFQPVLPFSISKDYNLVIRTIVPFISQEDVIPGTTQTGLSDITQSFFFSPKAPVGGWILAAGPVFLWPAATDSLLGTEKWGAGPTGLILRQEHGWTYGVLANHIWDYAGDHNRSYVSSTFLQPFLSYTTKKQTSFTVNSESTYDWNGGQWTIPFNFMISQLTKIGKMRVQFQLGARYYAESPSGGPDWGLRFVVTPLFPTGHKPVPHAPSAK